jgi:hypothetical protein
MLNNRSCKNFKVIGTIMVAGTCLGLDVISRLNAQSQAARVPADQLQQPAPRVEFEVVSVKPGDPNGPSSSGRSTPGGMEMRNTTLNTLVRSAYGLNEFQLVGGPKWAGSAKFNVVAKMPTGATRDQMPLMIQPMLADRFKLEFHRETRALQEYALEVAKGGSRLQDATEEDKAHAGTSQGRDRSKPGTPRFQTSHACRLASSARRCWIGRGSRGNTTLHRSSRRSWEARRRMTICPISSRHFINWG